MIRPHGWCVCIDRQYPEKYGLWIAERQLALLNPAHWLDWHHTPIIDDPRHVPMMWNGGALASGDVARRMKSVSAQTWLLFNEPERPEQANMNPSMARRQTQAFLRMAWEDDNEFQWTSPAVSVNMQDFDGLAWLTEYVRQLRRRGISRPSYWNIHLYHSETRARLEHAWEAWAKWYEVWGSGAPVIVSEVCAENQPYKDQAAVMNGCHDLLRNGDVSGVFWFVGHAENGWTNCSLCAVDLDALTVALTPLGEHWLELQAKAFRVADSDAV
jgi:hypothetical protein